MKSPFFRLSCAAIVVCLAFMPLNAMVTTTTLPASSHSNSIINNSPASPHLGLLILALAAFLVAVNIFTIGLAITMNFRRSLSSDPADGWEHPVYRALLPNVLATLYAANFKSPWPEKCSLWSMRRFQRRLLRTIRPQLKSRADAFAEQHISLWIWLQARQNVCQRWLHDRNMDKALECLSAARSPQARAELLVYLRSPAGAENEPVEDCTAKQLEAIKNLQVIMREHGYSISEEFEKVDDLEQSLHEYLIDSHSVQ